MGMSISQQGARSRLGITSGKAMASGSLSCLGIFVLLLFFRSVFLSPNTCVSLGLMELAFLPDKLYALPHACLEDSGVPGLDGQRYYSMEQSIHFYRSCRCRRGSACGCSASHPPQLVMYVSMAIGWSMQGAVARMVSNTETAVEDSMMMAR